MHLFRPLEACVAATGFAGIVLGAIPSAQALPNPASVFCAQSGGKSEILTNAAGGQFGVCILPDGQLVEEWAYFRSHSRQLAAPAGK